MKQYLKFALLAVVMILLFNVLISDLPTAYKVGYSVLFINISIGLIVPARYLYRSTEVYDIVPVKVFLKYIVEKLRKTNTFMELSVDESPFVVNEGRTVYIPNAGSDPTVVVNNAVWPLVAVQRTDNDVNYDLDAFSTVPTHVSVDELQSASYAKFESVIGSHMNTLADKVGDALLVKWAPSTAGQIISTTGDDVAGVGAQVGTRKGFHHKNLKSAMISMNTTNTPKTGRVAVIDDNMYEFFYDSLTDNLAAMFNAAADMKNGIVGRIHSFDVYTRSSVLQYADAVNTADAVGAALDGTDDLASLCYQRDQVSRAVGATKLFTDVNNPLYQGNLYSALVHCGGRKRRYDNLGVIAIRQGK